MVRNFSIITLNKGGENMKNNISDDEIREIIRANIVKLRADKGVTQTELGLEVGKSKTAVASWEQGLSIPDATTLFRLSKYFNKSIEYFYEKHPVSSVDIINENFNKITENVKNKTTYKGAPRQLRHKYSTQRPKVPPTLKVVTIDDNGEARVVEIDSAAIVTKPTIINSSHSSINDILNNMNKKEGGASD